MRPLAHLGGQKAATIAQIRVVGTELVAVIAHGDRPRLATKGREPAEMIDPFGLGQLVQTDLRGRPVVAPAKDVRGKGGRPHGVGVIVAQGEEGGFGAIGAADGHRGDVGRRDAPGNASSLKGPRSLTLRHVFLSLSGHTEGQQTAPTQA